MDIVGIVNQAMAANPEVSVIDYSPVFLALIVAVPAIVTSFVAPLIMTILTNKNRRLEKLEDYARQDVVAEQVKTAAAQTAEAARLLVIEQRHQAEKTKEVADQLATSNASTGKKLDVIHTLVNSNMTTSMKDQLDVSIANILLMQEVMSLKKDAGHEPTPEATEAVTVLRAKVDGLKTALKDRVLGATDVVEQLSENGMTKRAAALYDKIGAKEGGPGLVENTRAVKENTAAVKDNTENK